MNGYITHHSYRALCLPRDLYVLLTTLSIILIWAGKVLLRKLPLACLDHAVPQQVMAIFLALYSIIVLAGDARSKMPSRTHGTKSRGVGLQPS